MEGNYYKISSLSEAKEEIIKLKSVSDLSTVKLVSLQNSNSLCSDY